MKTEDIKITDVEIIKLNIPYKEPFVISLGVIESATNVVIKIHTNKGITGIGECAPFVYIVGETQETVFVLAQQIGKMLKGKNPLAINERMAEIERAVNRNYTLKSAFDMAFYDLLAKKAQLPLYYLLGGSKSREIHTDMTISIGEPGEMARNAQKFKEEGFPAIKIKLGTTLKEDVERIKAIRQSVGVNYPMRIDANQGWDATTAINTLKALAQYNIEHCEEPIPSWNKHDLIRVSKESPIPIMADESLFEHHDAFQLASFRACDYFNIKFSKSGGIQNALKINAIAEASGIKCQVGCMSESRFALTALVHFIFSSQNIVYYDVDSALMLDDDPVVEGIQYKGKGKWELGDEIGIGADFDDAYLDKMERVVV